VCICLTCLFLDRLAATPSQLGRAVERRSLKWQLLLPQRAWLIQCALRLARRAGAHVGGRHLRTSGALSFGRGAPPGFASFDVAGCAPLPPPTWGDVRLGKASDAPAEPQPWADTQGLPAGARPREVPGDAALAARLQAEEEQGVGSGPRSHGHAAGHPGDGWDSGAGSGGGWDARGGSERGEADAWGGAHDARPDTSEDAALAARLQARHAPPGRSLLPCKRAAGPVTGLGLRGATTCRRRCLAHRLRLGALVSGARIWALALHRRPSNCEPALLCRARRPTCLVLPGPGMRATLARSDAQAEEQARAAHNRPARQSRLARTLEASDAAVARQLAAEEEARLLRLLTGAPERPAGGWGAPYAPPAPAPSLQAGPPGDSPVFPGACACRAGRSCTGQPAAAPRAPRASPAQAVRDAG